MRGAFVEGSSDREIPASIRSIHRENRPFAFMRYIYLDIGPYPHDRVNQSARSLRMPDVVPMHDEKGTTERRNAIDFHVVRVMIAELRRETATIHSVRPPRRAGRRRTAIGDPVQRD